jgi:mono/diheme cytochrome c family protein
MLAFLISGTAYAASSSTEQAESQALYKKDCAMCHGPDAKGNTPIGKKFNVPDLLSPAVQKKSDAELTQVIENGKQKMPAFKAKLKPEQVKDLVAYIRGLAKPGSTAHK